MPIKHWSRRLSLVTALLWVFVGTGAAAGPETAWRAAIDASDSSGLWSLLPQVDVNTAAAKGKTALMVAASNGELALVRKLLASGAVVDQKNNGRGTALMFAAQYGRREVARLLLEHGAGLNLQGAKGFTALSIAVLKGHLELVRLLLDRGADTAVTDMHGWTPLMRAVHAGDVRMTRVLLSVGDNQAGKAGALGITPLHLAAAGGDLELVSLLLEHGASAAVTSEDGRTPVDVAAGAGHDAVVRLLHPR